MRFKRYTATGVACTAVLLSGGVLTASAQGNGVMGLSHPASIQRSVRNHAADLLEKVGIGEEGTPGAIDDGKELLPQATITLDQAIQAAQGAASGAVGEVDLEHYDGRLVFNVDIGDHDVKVDAETGQVLGSGID